MKFTIISDNNRKVEINFNLETLEISAHYPDINGNLRKKQCKNVSEVWAYIGQAVTSFDNNAIIIEQFNK